MPKDERELPSTIERSDEHAQAIYSETLESAEETYGDGERAHRTAWGSVKNVAEKKGDHWELKDEPGPSDERSTKPQAAKRRGEGETFGGIDVKGNSRDELLERAKKAGVTGYSHMNKKDLARALSRKEHD